MKLSMRSRIFLAPLAVLLTLALLGFGSATLWMGKQPDGSYLVSSGQRIVPETIAFDGRPSDMNLKPDEDKVAVLSMHEVFLANRNGVIARTRCAIPNADAGFHGVLWTGSREGAQWTPQGMRFVASTDQGTIQEFLYEDWQITPTSTINLASKGSKVNAVPGGMCIKRNKRTLFVAAANLNGVVEVDLKTKQRKRLLPTGQLPFEVKLTADESTLIVSNWGGRFPRKGDHTNKSQDNDIVIDGRGAPISGTVTLINLATGHAKSLEVGIHPTAIAVSGRFAFVTNAMSDSISQVDWVAQKVVRTIPIQFRKKNLLGAMPNAIAISGNHLLVCDGGDNAVAEIDIASGKTLGFRPAGYFPIQIQLAADGKTAYVLNSKGNGSVVNTNHGNPGNPHEFEGTISVLDLSKDLNEQTQLVSQNNQWDRDVIAEAKKLPFYSGAIKHVLYIIKENQTYDSIYGDMPEGNGDPSLCVLGEKCAPNHRALAREFTLFDNVYVSGTNSADGHAWCTQGMANDYLEHFYVGYSRTYPDDGDCAMSVSNGGCLWDTALKSGRTIRDYGEFCDDELSTFYPRKPKSWFEAYADWKNKTHKFQYFDTTRIPSLKPYVCTSMHYWPLIQSDQSRADVFIQDYGRLSRANKVPNLMFLTLVCDHGSGLDPEHPTYPAMFADNDLALGRVVEAVSKSPQWKDTAIFVIEDDGQALPDHVDGHRTPFLVISPYTRRHAVDHNFYTTVDMLRSIELILGLQPMNRFDALAQPITTCLQNEPNYTAYRVVKNNQALDEKNPPREQMSLQERYWADQTKKLDWRHRDAADPAVLSQIHWFASTRGRPYPEQYAVKLTAKED